MHSHFLLGYTVPRGRVMRGEMKYKAVALIGCLVLLQIVIACGGTPQPTPVATTLSTAYVYYSSGLAYAYDGNEQAIQDYNEAIRLDPQHALAYNLRGLANQALGNNTAANSDLRKADELMRIMILERP